MEDVLLADDVELVVDECDEPGEQPQAVVALAKQSGVGIGADAVAGPVQVAVEDLIIVGARAATVSRSAVTPA